MIRHKHNRLCSRLFIEPRCNFWSASSSTTKQESYSLQAAADNGAVNFGATYIGGNTGGAGASAQASANPTLAGGTRQTRATAAGGAANTVTPTAIAREFGRSKSTGSGHRTIRYSRGRWRCGDHRRCFSRRRLYSHGCRAYRGHSSVERGAGDRRGGTEHQRKRGTGSSGRICRRRAGHRTRNKHRRPQTPAAQRQRPTHSILSNLHL